MNRLDVKLYSEIIGTITLLNGDKSILAFNDEYVGNQDRATLSLSFKNSDQELLTNFRPSGPALLPFFSNLLPEGALREFLAEQLGIKPSREFHLLWGLGRDLPGAVSVDSDEEAQLQKFPNSEDSEFLGNENVLRFSLAGVQLKFSAIRVGERLTIPAKGLGGEWIVKLPSNRFEFVPENEFSFMTLAGMIGIEVPEIMLLDTKEIEGIPEGVGRLRDEKAFAVKRFDRSDDGPIHIEDFAQIFNLRPDDKYGKASYRNIAEVIGIESTAKDVEEFVRRLIFSILIGNEDMHLKNWSFIYRDRKTAQLAPAYDLLSTIPYIHSGNAALKFATTKKMADIDRSELEELADRAKLPRGLVARTASETVEIFLDVWGREKNNLVLPSEIIKKVDENIRVSRISKSTTNS
ncbi:MAG: type II toxin-antitoxin system HipA family toxin [Pyrinomonadaceae bacterium]